MPERKTPDSTAARYHQPRTVAEMTKQNVHTIVQLEQTDKAKPGTVLDQAPEPSSLRSFLEERLPSYMVPALFVALESLPLTATGKVDRNALPAPDASALDSREEYIAPRTPLEEMVAEIWAEVLGVERVGVHDNFWDLGGHSLLATRALARVNDAFGLELPLQALFKAPTLEGFTIAIGESLLEEEDEA